jgi:hypothetical protein
MQQLEIQYFFPLTEQIPLDLDYTPSNKYDEKKLQERIAGSVLIAGGTGTAWATISNNIEPSFQIDIDDIPITVLSKNKPNIFRRYLYKIMGVKWKAK